MECTTFQESAVLELQIYLVSYLRFCQIQRRHLTQLCVQVAKSEVVQLYLDDATLASNIQLGMLRQLDLVERDPLKL